MTMLDWYVDGLGDPCPESPAVMPPSAGERVEFAGTVFDWRRRLMLARLEECRYVPDLSVDVCLDIRTFLRPLDGGA